MLLLIILLLFLIINVCIHGPFNLLFWLLEMLVNLNMLLHDLTVVGTTFHQS